MELRISIDGTVKFADEISSQTQRWNADDERDIELEIGYFMRVRENGQQLDLNHFTRLFRHLKRTKKRDN